MKTADVYPDLVRHVSGNIPARSALPPGGNPVSDAAYTRWLQCFVDAANLRWCDKHFPSIPDRDIVNTFQLTGHLYHWLIGCKFPPGHGPNYLHRLRFVAVQFKFRPEEIRTESHRYLAELIESSEPQS
jgi:hypothetical protein